MLRVFALALHQTAPEERSLLLILVWGGDWLCRKLHSDCHDTEDAADDTVDVEDAVDNESVVESRW